MTDLPPQIIDSDVFATRLAGNASITNSSFFWGEVIDNARVINSPLTGGILSGFATVENMHQEAPTLTGSSYINNVKFYAYPGSKVFSYSNGVCGNLITDENGSSYIDRDYTSGIPFHFGCKSSLH